MADVGGSGDGLSLTATTTFLPDQCDQTNQDTLTEDNQKVEQPSTKIAIDNKDIEQSLTEDSELPEQTFRPKESERRSATRKQTHQNAEKNKTETKGDQKTALAGSQDNARQSKPPLIAPAPEPPLKTITSTLHVIIVA